MGRRSRSVRMRMALVMLRSLLVGAVSGLVGGGLIFFLFGFIGFAGAPVSVKIENGWSALLDPGLGKGLAAGVGIGVGLVTLMGIWTALTRRFEHPTARPWLSILAGVVVVLYNLESLRNSAGWDLAGMATVFGISLLVAGIVWLVAPWVLKDWPRSFRAENADTTGFVVPEDG